MNTNFDHFTLFFLFFFIYSNSLKQSNKLAIYSSIAFIFFDQLFSNHFYFKTGTFSHIFKFLVFCKLKLCLPFYIVSPSKIFIVFSTIFPSLSDCLFILLSVLSPNSTAHDLCHLVSTKHILYFL